MKKNKKFSPLQTVRLAIQIVFFIILPGVYINAFSGIKQIYTGIINQSFSFTGYLPQLIEVIAVVPVTIILGRFFCGWMCAFGTLGDLLYLFSRKVFKVKFRINNKIDSVLKYFKFVILAFLVIFVWTFDISIFKGASPWDAFGVIAAFGKVPDIPYAFTEFTIGFLILLAVIIASFFIERFFCRYLCPLGAVFSIVSRLKFVKINKPSEKCGSCRICTNSCAMGIPLYKHDKINSGECIQCFKCVSACPRSNTSVNIGKEDMRTGAAAALAVTCISCIYYTGNFVSQSVSTGSSTNITSSLKPSKPSENLKYADGTYEGSGTGFRGATTVSVTVENDTITDIQVISYGDDTPYFERAYNYVSSQILSSQSTDVDAVSGATFSSNGIMEAVANALENAKLSSPTSSSEGNTSTVNNAGDTQESTLPADSDEPSNGTVNNQNTGNEGNFNGNGENGHSAKNQDSAESGTNKESTASTDEMPSAAASSTESKAAENTPDKNTSSMYRDGTYQGSARGFRRSLTTVSVSISNDKITDIQVLSTGDDRRYFDAASSVISEILEAQSTDVDAVSGATFSSMGIMNAVADALESAQ